MKFLAEFVMASRARAITVAVVTAILPMAFWISAATVALTSLRQGLNHGLNIFIWALLPTLLWLSMGDPTPTIVLVGTAILSLVLRATSSWNSTLLVATVVGIVTSLILSTALDDIVRQIIAIISQQKSSNDQTWQQLNQISEDQIVQLLLNIFSVVHLGLMILCLLLARYWQSLLYNPGGLRQEIHNLRLPIWFSGGLLLLIMLEQTLSTLRWTPILSVPLIMATLGLVHGVMGKINSGRIWLTGFYLLTLLAGFYMYMLLCIVAVVDSVCDFRKYIRTKE